MNKKYRVLALKRGKKLMYSKGRLYTEIDGVFTKIGSIPTSRIKKILNKNRLADRLLRLEPRAVCELESGDYLLSYSGHIVRVDVKERVFISEHEFRDGMNNPLFFTRTKNLRGFSDTIYYGEYFSNNNAEAVCIYARKGTEWVRKYAFPPQTVYHIHNLVPDYNHDCIYILTGDFKNESAIWVAKSDFNDVKPLLRGKQQYRSCVAFPYKDGLLYATDTSRENNYIYYVHNDFKELKHDVVAELPGPCVFGTQYKGKYYLATSVEADDTVNPRRFLFTYKLAKGIKDRKVHILELDLDGRLVEIKAFEKDWLPMLAFQFGNCSFPYMHEADGLYVNPTGVRKYDGGSLLLKQ